MNTFITDKLMYSIIDKCLRGGEIVATFMSFAVAFCADKDFKALIDFLRGNFSKVGKANITI